MAGLAVDWSKCYDNLLLDILTLVAERAGIPPALSKPMIAAYRQPRAVLLQGAVGTEKRPDAGLPKGHRLASDGDIHVHLKVGSCVPQPPIAPLC